MSAIIAGLTLGMNFAEGVTNASASRSAARSQLKLLRGAESDIKEVATKKRGMAYDSFGNKMSTLSERVGLNLADTTRKYDYEAGRSGFAYSGTVETRRESDMGKIKTSAKESKDTLIDSLGQSLLSIGEQESQQLGQLAAQKAQLKAQSNDRFLGIF